MAIDSGVVLGLFNEEFNKEKQYRGLQAAPIMWTDTLKGTYTIATRFGGLKLEEQGFDPMVPLSWEAPSRPVRDSFEDRNFQNLRFSEHYFASRNELLSARNSNGVNIEARAAKMLARIHRDRHEYQVAELYKDSGNYGDSDTVTLDNLFAAIIAAANAINGDRAAIVAPPSVVTKLMQLPEFQLAIGGGNTGIVGGVAMFNQFLMENHGLELISSPVRVVDNVSDPSDPVKIQVWENATTPNWLGVVGLSGDASMEPSFATTVAFTETFEDPEIAQVWTVEEQDARGTKVIAESVYNVVVGDENQGVFLNFTDV